MFGSIKRTGSASIAEFRKTSKRFGGFAEFRNTSKRFGGFVEFRNTSKRFGGFAECAACEFCAACLFLLMCPTAMKRWMGYTSIGNLTALTSICHVRDPRLVNRTHWWWIGVIYHFKEPKLLSFHTTYSSRAEKSTHNPSVTSCLRIAKVAPALRTYIRILVGKRDLNRGLVCIWSVERDIGLVQAMEACTSLTKPTYLPYLLYTH